MWNLKKKNQLTERTDWWLPEQRWGMREGRAIGKGGQKV